ncbi:ABC transporter substrate-binding protein [Microbacterium halotolerans]|uniref:ABC transporter substrate-binding protein n=1 Tax=Microbacterium halotolerans TaxID=246613 RepID=UPI000E6AD7B1|nr:ABC transporter substrate-binding protein [Microbacterium halotolerans]
MTSHSTHHRAAIFLAGLTALALGVTGCASAVQQQNETESAAEPVAGGILTVAQAQDAQPNNLQAGRQGNASWAANVFETLTAYDENREPQPLLAEDWTIADDGLSIDIVLRDDVTFHSGRALTAEDVKYSLEYNAASSSQVAFVSEGISAIEVTGDTTLTLTFDEPSPSLFDLFEYAFIMDSETAESGLDDGSAVIGTGPFTFENWSPGSEITLKRYEDYWGEPAYVDGIDISVITDSTAMLNAVRSERSQLAIGMNTQDVRTMSSNAGFTTTPTSGAVYPLGLNIDEAPFESKDVRQAVQFAIDRERIADQVFGGSATPTNLFWAPDTPGYPEEFDDAYAYDPDKATEMIESAGAKGATVEITVISLPANTSVAEVVRSNLEEVGLKPSINVVENAAFGEQQIAGELGAAFLPLHGLNGLSPVSLINVLPSLREGNSSHFWTDEYAQLRDALADAQDDEARSGALLELTEYMVDEAFTANLVRVDGENVVSTDVHDLEWSNRAYLRAGTAFLSE